MARLASSYDKMSPFPEGETGASGSCVQAGMPGLREFSSAQRHSPSGQEGAQVRGGPRCVASGGRGPTEKGHGAGCCHALLDVPPVGQLGVALLPRAAVELEERQPGGGEGQRAENQTETEREKKTQRAPERQTERDRQTETEMEREPKTRRKEQEGRQWLERDAPRESQHPLCPETHRDQRSPPVPQLGQQPVGQIHALVDTRAELHGQWHVQHLWGRVWLVGPGVRPRGMVAVEGVSGCTWFMPRTICWNLAERFMRAQPPPWERRAVQA